MQTHENDLSFRKVAVGSERNFGLTFAAVFGLFGLWPVVRHHDPRWLLLVAAAAFLVVALAAPRLLGPLNRAWFKFGLLLSRIVSPIVMGLMFYGGVTPLGWIMRKRGADLLRLKLDPSAGTYWIERGASEGRGGMTKQF
ncbi:SxtJ family membrane protein [Methylocella sp.]|uniref:SxtJ family membrane protein n=1 Tax=Methylocella sp. TaxID=1978226 RepID=UPI00378325BE